LNDSDFHFIAALRRVLCSIIKVAAREKQQIEGSIYMSVNFSSLFYSSLPDNIKLQSPTYSWLGNVSRDDPSIEVMTDFQMVIPIAVGPMATIDDANEKMIACGVRLLFVQDDTNKFIGLITAADILGERPVNYLREHGGTRHTIAVQDIMTPTANLEALDIKSVLTASVGEIVEIIQRRGRQHMLVYERLPNGSPTVRGIFSSTHIERRLGTNIPIVPRANTFAELEMALAN